MTVEEIIHQVRRLEREEQVRLLDELTQLVAGPPKILGPATALRGVGRALWDGADAQEYVDAERDAWSG